MTRPRSKRRVASTTAASRGRARSLRSGAGQANLEKPTPVDGISAADTITERHKETKDTPALSVEEERAQLKAQRTWIQKDAKGRDWRHRIINGCEYRCLDVDAGTRSYAGDKERAWTGGYDTAVIDLCTGGTLANVMFSASRHERAAIPAVVRKLERALGGELPERMALDRGFSNNKTFRFLTRRGIVPVAPWRKPHHQIDKRWKERRGSLGRTRRPTLQALRRPRHPRRQRDRLHLRQGRAGDPVQVPPRTHAGMPKSDDAADRLL